MGQSVDARIAYGFSLDGEGTPDELEEYGPYGDEPFSKLLDISYYGRGDYSVPFFHVKSTEIWAMDGTPKMFIPSILGVPTDEEQEAILECFDHVKSVIEQDPDFDERWSPKVGSIGWHVFGQYG